MLINRRTCTKFGRQAWVLTTIVVTEFLIVLKFGWETITIPLPTPVAYSWLAGVAALVCWTLWAFFIQPTQLQSNFSPSRKGSKAKVN